MLQKEGLNNKRKRQQKRKRLNSKKKATSSSSFPQTFQDAFEWFSNFAELIFLIDMRSRFGIFFKNEMWAPLQDSQLRSFWKDERDFFDSEVKQNLFLLIVQCVFTDMLHPKLFTCVNWRLEPWIIQITEKMPIRITAKTSNGNFSTNYIKTYRDGFDFFFLRVEDVILNFRHMFAAKLDMSKLFIELQGMIYFRVIPDLKLKRVLNGKDDSYEDFEQVIWSKDPSHRIFEGGFSISINFLYDFKEYRNGKAAKQHLCCIFPKELANVIILLGFGF